MWLEPIPIGCVSLSEVSNCDMARESTALGAMARVN